MEIPRHVIFASYWLSLKSSQSSIEATEYVEGNVGDIYFSFGNVFSFFFLPTMLLCAGRTFPHDWTMCDLNACYRGSWWKIVLATAGLPFIMHFFTDVPKIRTAHANQFFSKQGGWSHWKIRTKKSKSKQDFKDLTRNLRKKIYGIINFRNNLTDVDCRLIYR